MYAISFRAPTPGCDIVLTHVLSLVIIHIGGELFLVQPKPSKQTVMTLLGATGMTLQFEITIDGVHIKFPADLPFASLVGKGAWTIKMTAVM